MDNIINYILIAVVVLMLIALPIMMNSRNKKETQKIQEQTNSLKVGDKILTTSGVYGTIVELKYDDSQKLVVIETGGKNKSFMTVDAYAIYTVFKSDEELKAEQEKHEQERAMEAERKAQAKAAKKNKKAKSVSADEKKIDEVKEEAAEKIEENSSENSSKTSAKKDKKKSN